jgi:hypothetical protein
LLGDGEGEACVLNLNDLLGRANGAEGGLESFSSRDLSGN